MASLAELLNAKIGKGGKSKAYVASHLGVSEKTIENYMNGKREPKPAALARLAEILDFDLNEMTEHNVRKKVEREPPPSQIGKALPDDYKEKQISNLTETSRLMAESNASLARSYESLVQMVKGLTAGVDPKRIEFLTASLGAIQDLIEQQFVKRTQFGSRAEVRAVLNTKRNEILDHQTGSDGKLDSLGKRSKPTQQGS